MNKVFRYTRTHHARKNSLKSNLTDVFNRAAQSADPEILSLIEAEVLKMRKNEPLPMYVKPLLLYPDLVEFAEEPEEVLPDFSNSDISTPGSSCDGSGSEAEDDEIQSDETGSDMEVEDSSSSSSSSSSSDDDMEEDTE